MSRDLDPRTPVIVGVGQLLDREGGRAPTDLMIEAIGSAEADAGSAGLAATAQVIGVVPVISWRYHDPARLVAAGIGADPAVRWYPPMGGNTPQLLVNRAAVAIASGDAEVAIVCGGESYRTRMTLRRAGDRPDWVEQGEDDTPTLDESNDFKMGHPAELELGIVLPTQTYPMFENALRHRAGRTAPEQSGLIGELWAGFSRVAAANPYAVDRTIYTAEEISTVTEDNRIIGFPYTKHMVSNPDLDAASATILCSVERATALGIPRDRWVFPWSGTDGNDPYLSERSSFTGSSAIRIAGSAALELAGVGIDDVAHIDLYSCFPSAVEIAALELGIGLDRQLTVYGGLCFAGGPWNNPVGHAIATMVGVLREDAGSVGFVTANGGNIQKHAFGVYSSRPGPANFRHSHPQFAIDNAEPTREVAVGHEGPVEVEAWTVMHERDTTMARAHAALLLPDGRRAWGATNDPDVMAAMEVDDFAGRAAHRSADGALTF
jgi:acetyl-CoA C-acetyltransferase